MESTLKDLKERRSIRAYKPEQIKEEKLQKILEAGTYAPTGMGVQSPKIVVVQDKESRDYLSELNAKYLGSDSDPFYGAPTVCAVFAPKNFLFSVADAFCAAENMVLEATELGVSSCIISRGEETFSGEEGEAMLRDWNVPAGFIARCFVILGYCEGAYPQPKPRRAGRFLVVEQTEQI